MKKVEEEHIFHFKDGNKAHNIADLKEAIEVISDEDFDHHVTEENNDFANWIEFSHGNKELAEDIRKAKEKKKILEVLEVEVKEPEEQPVETKPEVKEEVREIRTTATHHFIVKEFFFGLVMGLILGLVIMGVLYQMGVIP